MDLRGTRTARITLAGAATVAVLTASVTLAVVRVAGVQPPAVPETVNVAAGDSRLAIRWVPGRAGRAPVGYRVSTEPASVLVHAPAGATGAVVTGLSNGRRYRVILEVLGEHGAARVVRTAPAAPFDPAPPPPVTGVRAATSGDGVEVRWIEPQVADLAGSVVRLAAGAPPSDVRAGAPVVVSSPGSAALPSLRSGVSYGVSVFPIDVGGVVGRPSSLRLSGSVLASAVRVVPSRSGVQATVTATLRDRNTGRPLAGREVFVETAPVGPDARWRPVARRRSDPRGQVGARLPVRSPVKVRIRYEGAGVQLPAVSVPSTVSTAPRVRVSVPAVVMLGRPAMLRGSVTPPLPGTAWFEVVGPRGWRTTVRAPIDRSGRFTARVAVSRPGRHWVRAVTPPVGGFTRGSARAVPFGVADDVAGRLPARPPRVPTPAQPFRLLVTGDSLAYWLGEQLAHVAGPRVATRVDSRVSTGLARPDVMDWPKHAARQVTVIRPEAVVVFMGGNDCQPMRVGGTGAWAPGASSAWAREYARRVRELVDVWTRSGALVYWVGMPIARDPATAGCFRAQTAAARSVALAMPGMVWLDTWRHHAPGGRFAQVIAGTRVRQDDGIHLTSDGTRWVTRKILGLFAGDVRIRG